MRRWRVIGMTLGLAICIIAVGAALAATRSKPPAKPHATNAAPISQVKHANLTTHRASRHSLRRSAAGKGATDPDEKSGESETTPGDSVTDRVEQPPGADHQCPPDCAPGENP
jgi:hypothetical protein